MRLFLNILRQRLLFSDKKVIIDSEAIMSVKNGGMNFVPEKFSQMGEKELLAFASENNILLTLSELVHIQSFAKESKRAITFDELAFFESIRKIRNNEKYSAFDKVEFDTPNPHIAEAYARYLKLVEAKKDKLGIYPCFDDLSRASYANLKQNEGFNKSLATIETLSATIDGKKEEGKIALTAYTAKGKNGESLVLGALSSLFESRYLPFSLSVTGEYKEPNKEKADELASFSYKTDIPTTKFDIYDNKCAESGRDTVLAVGYAQANCVARHYAKEEDKILFLPMDGDSDLYVRRLSELFADKRTVKLIVDGRFAKDGELCFALYEFIPSFKVDSLSCSGLALVVRARDEEELTSAILSHDLTVQRIGEVTSDGIISYGDSINIPAEVVSGYSVRKNVNITVNDKKSTRTSKPGAIASVYLEKGDLATACSNVLSDYGVCSQKGLTERFNYTSGGAVISPLGGKYALTPALVSAYKLPVQAGTEDTLVTTTVAYPSLFVESPFIGAINSVTSAVSRLIASGVKRRDISVLVNLSYKTEGEALSSLLGAFCARQGLGVDTLQNNVNKDEESSFVACAGGVISADKLIHNTFDRVGRVYRLSLSRDEYGMIDFEYASRLLDTVSDNIESGNIVSASVIGEGGAQACIIKSCIGNGLGFDFDKPSSRLFDNAYGDLIVMCNETAPLLDFSPEYLGSTDTDGRFDFTKERSLNNFGVTQSFTAPLESVFKTTPASRGLINNIRFKTDKSLTSVEKFNKPQVLIPVFDSSLGSMKLARAFKISGAEPIVFKINKYGSDAKINEFISVLDATCILALPDGIGTEEEYCSLFRKEGLFEKIEEFIKEKDGLIYGEGAGARALSAMGLLTGKLRKRKDESIIFKQNNIARRVNVISELRVASVLSPWLYGAELGEKYLVPVSCEQGAISFSEGVLEGLIENGQIATQYVDNKGFATMEAPSNPTGSVFAVEGLTSPCGRVFARVGTSINGGFDVKNRDGNLEMKIIESGVKYFKQ